MQVNRETVNCLSGIPERIQVHGKRGHNGHVRLVNRTMFRIWFFQLFLRINAAPPFPEPFKNRFTIPPAKDEDEEGIPVKLLCENIIDCGNVLAGICRVRAAAIGLNLFSCGRQERQAGTGKDGLNLLWALSSQGLLLPGPAGYLLPRLFFSCLCIILSSQIPVSPDKQRIDLHIRHAAPEHLLTDAYNPFWKARYQEKSC